MCCCGQPVILAGDFNADPIVIPSLAKGISDGQWVDLERAFALGRGVPPSTTCQFQLDEDKGSRRDFLLACPVALAAASACYVSPDRWFTPHFSVLAEFSLSSWNATVDRARTHSPLWPACWLQSSDRSRSSTSPKVRDIWDVYIREVGFVPLAVREELARLCSSPDVDSSCWLLWSKEAELVLLVLIFLLVALPFRAPVVMLAVALFLFTLCDWVVGVMIVFIMLIALMSLMLLILDSS